MNLFKALLAIRKNVVVDWDSMISKLSLIDKEDQEILDSLLLEELNLIRDEAINRAIITTLSAGLSNGRIEGFVGRLDLSHISIASLNDGLNMVNDGMRLLETVQTMVYVVKDIRNSVANNSWEKFNATNHI